ncbi:MAG: hypothetical protein IT462_08765 [Planctomycetes bacterium]|nr:hypothetical protein [Planctomycetota bacterium]
MTLNNTWRAWFLSLLAIIFAGALTAQGFDGIRLQGRLTDTAGAPITTAVTITVRVYSGPVGGVALYTEAFTLAPSATGVFSVIIGQTAPLPGTIDFSAAVYAGVTVEADAEMAPRYLLTSTSFAHYARLAGDSNRLGGLLPADYAQLASASTTFTGSVTATTFNGDLTGNVTGNLTGNVTGNISGSAATFTGALVGDVTGTQAATVVSTVGGQTAANVASGAVLANASTSANTFSTIVRRDASGNFVAGAITANLVGNVTGNVTGNVSGSAATFTGNLAGDVTGPQATTVVATVGGQTAANVATGAVLANASTSANTAGAIVRRDGTGNFNATTVSANLTGNVTGNVNGSIGAVTPNTGAFTTVAASGAVTANSTSTLVGAVTLGNDTATPTRGSIIINDNTATNTFDGTLRTAAALTADRTYDLPDASGTLALTSDITGLYLLLAGGTMSGDIAMGGNDVTGAALLSSTNVTVTSLATAGVVHNSAAGVLSTSLLVNADVDAAAAIAYSKLNLATSIVNADISGTAAIAYSKLNLATSIVNADISGTAAIAYSKLNLASSIVSADLVDDTIVNADVSPTAAIAYSKLNLATSIVDADISPTAAIAYSKLNLTTSIVNADISGTAAIAYSKLNLTTSIVNADVAAGAAIAYSKLNLTGSILGSDLDAATNIVTSGTVTAADLIADGSLVVGTDTATPIAGAVVIEDDQASNGFNGTILTRTGGLTADRTYELPDNDGTLALLSDITGGGGAGSFTTLTTGTATVTSLSTIGVVHNNASGDLSTSLIVDADVSGTAAIAYSKLNLVGSVVTGDITDGTITGADINATTTITANDFIGDGSALTDLDAGNITTGNLSLVGGSIAAAILSAGDDTASPTAGEIYVHNNGAVDGIYGRILTGTLTTAQDYFLPDVSGEITVAGNTFNGASQLVQLNGSGALPTLSGVNLTNVNAAQLLGATWAAPLAIGTGTPSTGAFTALTSRTSVIAGGGGNNGELWVQAATGAQTIYGSGDAGLLQLGSDAAIPVSGKLFIHDDQASNGNIGTLITRVGGLTNDRTYELQDASGTLAFLSDITGGGAASFTTLSASSTVTFSGLSSLGVVHNSAAGVLSTSLISGADLAGNIAISTTGNIATTGTGTITSANGLTVAGVAAIGGLINTGQDSPVNQGGLIIHDATGGNGNVGQLLTANNLTSTRTYTLPDATGTIALTSDITTALTTLNASNITTGTLNDLRLSSNVTLAGNTFNGASQLVQLNGSGNLVLGTRVNLVPSTGSLTLGNLTGGVGEVRITSGATETVFINGSGGGVIQAFGNIVGGSNTLPGKLSLNDSVGGNEVGVLQTVATLTGTRTYTLPDMDGTFTLQGNTFNGASQLVQLDGTGKLPAIDGSLLTNLPSGGTLVGDVSGAIGSNTVDTVGGATAANIALASAAVATATPNVSGDKLVLRNSFGDFAGNVITAVDLNATSNILVGSGALTTPGLVNVTNNAGTTVVTLSGTTGGVSAISYNSTAGFNSTVSLDDAGGVNGVLITSFTTGSRIILKDNTGDPTFDTLSQSGATTLGSITGGTAATVSITDGTATTITLTGSSGNITAATFTGALTGNASSATTAVSFSGALVGDVSGTQGATVVDAVGGETAANVAAGAVLANAATDANTASTIVRRDAGGDFTAGDVYATSFNGAAGVNSTLSLNDASAVNGVLITAHVTGSRIILKDNTGDPTFDTLSQSGATTLGSITGGTAATVSITNGTATTITLTGSSGNITAATFTGNLTGNVTGNVSSTGLITTTGSITTTAGGTITSAGTLTASGGLSVTGNIAGTGTITGITSITATGLITTTNNITTTGTGTITSAGLITASGGLSVTGNITGVTQATVTELKGAGANKYANKATVVGDASTKIFDLPNSLVTVGSIVVASIESASTGFNYTMFATPIAGNVRIEFNVAPALAENVVVSYIVVNP